MNGDPAAIASRDLRDRAAALTQGQGSTASARPGARTAARPVIALAGP